MDDNFVMLRIHKIMLDEGNAIKFLNIEHIPIITSICHPQFDNELPHHKFKFLIHKLEWVTQLYADQIVDLDIPMDGYDLKSGNHLVTMGFGRTCMKDEIEYSFSNVLQEVTLKYITNVECNSDPFCWQYLLGSITGSSICAVSIDEKESMPCMDIFYLPFLFNMVMYYFKIKSNLKLC
jgi:hypothetical protein